MLIMNMCLNLNTCSNSLIDCNDYFTQFLRWQFIARGRAISFIRGGESQSTLFLDGRKNPWPAAVGPTIFVDVDPASTLSREEIFGPVLVVTRFKSEEEALKLANDSDYGLGAAVWTRDLSRAHRMSRRLKAGSVFVNNYNDGDMTVPFGGYKQSGNGRDKSLHALEKFTELKTIWIALES